MRTVRVSPPVVRSFHVCLALASLLLMMLVIIPAPLAHAATITVNSNAGTKVTDLACTLREAIENANNGAATWPDCAAGAAGADTIVLPAGATITLSAVDFSPGTEDATGLPMITSNITIEGNNAVIQRSMAVGTPNFRIFYVYGTGALTLNNVTVRNGKTASSADGYSANGGGIEVTNDGSLGLYNCTISGNATGSTAGTAGWGGGISGEYGAKLTIANSTISGNSTGTSVSGSFGSGGGIATNGAAFTMTNTTVSENSASGSSSYGGGMYIYPAASGALVTSSTIVSNTAGRGGGIYAYPYSPYLSLRNTIVALNTATNVPTTMNCDGVLVNGGNNIDSGTSCVWGGPLKGSMNNTDPVIGPLANNGGSTWTHALGPRSLAIDGVTYNAPNGSPSTDQRGRPRPVGARYDIGAYESDLFLFLPLVQKRP